MLPHGLIHSVVDDVAKDRISILFMNNVTWKSYYFVTFFFWCCVMLVLEVMFAPSLLFTFSVASVIVSINIQVISIPFISWGYFTLASIETVAFALFISSVFSSPFDSSSSLTHSFLAVSMNIILNLPGYITFITKSQSIFSILPLSSLVTICYDMISPNVFGTSGLRLAIIMSIIMSLIYLTIGYVVWFLRIDVGQLLDKFFKKKQTKNGYVEMDNATLVMDDDVAKEDEYVDAAMSYYTPSCRKGNSLMVQDVSKVFFTKNGKKQVFPPISFCVKDYEVYGLLGPNGAGKTTLISILTSKLNANKGEVRVFGYPSGNSIVKKLISVVPQFDVFFDELTVNDHLQLVARLHGLKEGSYVLAAKGIAAQVGLDRDVFSYTSSKLSGGQKRRLTLGMALMSKPKLLFMDEPTVEMECRSEL